MVASNLLQKKASVTHPLLVGLVLALSFSIHEHLSFAQPAPSETDRAIDAGQEAIALYRDGRWADAYDRFAVADRTTHSPVFVLYMARCKRNVGRLLDAKRLF